MKVTTRNFKYTDQYPLRLVFFGLTATTLYFQTNLADPFNPPKSWILLLFSAYLLGYLNKFRKIIFNSRVLKQSYIVIIIFLMSLLIATLATDVKYVGFFGDTFRKNGLLVYTCFGILFISAFMFIRYHNLYKLFNFTYFIAAVSIIYGFLQTTGKDFVDWVNPHNSLIGTQGNPNFAAAAMAIMAMILITSLFSVYTPTAQKFIGGSFVLMLLILIYRSNARQGLISFGVGLIFFLIILMFNRNKKLGFVGLSAGIILFFTSILGMLQIGPLQHLLYKPSVTVRGYYWHAAVEMFKSHPLLGIGIDRYGAYFLEYRDVGYPLNYGFTITSSNAHNLYLQFFATGGILLGISYLFLTAWVLFRAIQGLRNNSGEDRIILGGIFCAWISYQAQAFVSIDNLGLAIWGWVLGGAVIGLSAKTSSDAISEREIYKTSINRIDLKRVGISGTATLLCLVVVVFQYRVENYTFKASGMVEGRDQASIKLYRDTQLKVIQAPLVDPTYVLRAGSNLVQFGLSQDGYSAILDVHNRDPRNMDALVNLAIYHEFKGELKQAVHFREKIAILDPWNAPNYLQLGRNYKKLEDFELSRKMFEKVISFATGDNGGPISQQAIKELQG